MKTLFLSMPILTLFLFSCTAENKNNNQPSKITEIKINSSDEIIRTWFDKIEQIQFTPLETKKEALIGGIDKIISCNNKYYIWDRFQKCIFVYNHNGSFDFKIDSHGRGPGEYRELRDIHVDADANIFILDYAKILQFDQHGHLKKEIDLTALVKKIKAGPLQFKKDRENGWLFWIGSQSDFTKTPSLHATDKSFNIKWSRFMKGTEQPDYTRFTGTPENTFFTADWLNDTIYNINNQKIYPEYVINFGKKDLNSSKIKNIKKGELRHFILNSDLCYRVYNALNTSEYLIFDHGIKGKVRKVFYNKEKQTSIYGSRVFPSPELPGLIKNTDGKNFIGTLFPSSFANNKENIPKQYRAILASVKENDNPIIFKVTMK